MDRNQPQSEPIEPSEGESGQQIPSIHAVPTTGRDKAIRWHVERLQGAEALQLPHRRQAPNQRTGNRGYLDCKLDNAIDASAKQYACKHQTTVTNVLLALWQVLLFRYTHASDLIVAINLADVEKPENQKNSTNPPSLLRQTINKSMGFDDCVSSTQQALSDLSEHQLVAPEVLAAAIGLPTDDISLPFARYLFESIEIADQENSDEITCPTQNLNDTEQSSAAQYELCLKVTVGCAQNATTLAIDFDTDLFESKDLAPILAHMSNLLRAALDAPKKSISSLMLMSEQERSKVLDSFNDTQLDYPRNSSLTDLLIEQADQTPERIAVSFGSRKISYKKLLVQVDRMATWLKRYSLGPDTLVGVSLPRTPELLISYLAIQRTGAAYLPIDPGYPAERRQFVLDDAGVKLLITSESLMGLTRPAGVSLVLLEHEWDDIQNTEIEAIESDASPNDLAYVIYTSGSTGKPKGVQNTRRNLVNQLLAMKHRLQLDQYDSILALSSVAFDISILELYLPLLCGARCHIVSRETASDGKRISEALDTESISVFQATPTTWRLLLEAGWKGDGHMMGLMGGEPLPRDLARILVPQLRSLWNLYGPTETTGFCTSDQITDPEAMITVGTPLSNYQISIRDPQGELCPINVAGEICVSGDGMSRGYLNRPDLNEKSFVRDTARNNRKRLYLSGDIGRWLPDGRIEYLGRKDNQVKLRGFRIELGEIESTLASANGVDHAVVALIKSDDEHFLAAYVVGEDQGSTPDLLSEHLKAHLPIYMVPTSYTFMDALPTTPSGKVDRQALPAPEHTVLKRRLDDPPLGTTELKLASLWADLLNTADIDRQDNFFALGGHSLLAMRFISQVRSTFSTELSVQTMVTATLAQIAELVDPHRAIIVGKGTRKRVQSNSEPMYFNSAGRRLFGVFHPALDGEGNKTTDTPRGAILICQPLGHEYQRMQRAVRLLAASLAERAYDVFRFDYAGTGDSSSNLVEISISDWKQNIADASALLHMRSKTETLSGIGIRMGALLLANSAPRSLNHCVLWDPVFNSRHWIETVDQMTRSAMQNLDRYRKEQHHKQDSELFGYLYSTNLLRELEQLSADAYDSLWTGNSLLLSSSESIHGRDSLEEPIQKRLVKPTQVKICDDRQRWNDFAVADDMVLADRSSQLITSWFR